LRVAGLSGLSCKSVYHRERRDSSMSADGDIRERLTRVAQEQGIRPALVQHGARQLSYAELLQASEHLGAALAERGIGPEAIVGLALGRSIEHVVGCLAAWRAGAAFLPLDLHWPDDRLAFVLAEARPAVVLTTSDQLSRFRRLGAPCSSDVWRGLEPSEAPAQRPSGEDAPPNDSVLSGLRGLSPGHTSHPASCLVRRAPPDRLAYLIYTSGSTGQPKGVDVTHRGLVNLLDSQVAAFRLSPASRVLWLLSPVFDASVSDVGTALLAGATLFIEPWDENRDLDWLTAILHQRQITHLDLPPALLRRLAPEAMPASLQTLVIGGETCPPAVVRRWARRVRLVNVYGPTEATVCSSLGVCDADTWSEPLLGQPLPGVRYHVRDESLNAVPQGVAGELCIAGDCLARGYRARPELTAQKFVMHHGERLYRSGDLVRQRDDGEYVFLGRIDRQVKVRGMRVEPEEIEARLCEHAGVVEAAVVKRELLEGRAEGLVAFVRGAAGLTTSELAQHLRRLLPAWMVPPLIVLVAELPRTATGKVDLARLEDEPLPGARESEGQARLGGSLALPLLLEVCAAVLGVPALSPDGGFLEQGGDSLSLLQVVTAAGARGLVVPPALLADCPRLRDVAGWLDEQGSRGAGVLAVDWLRQDVERLLDQTPLSRLAGEPAPPSTSGTVLVTGATGFLGAHVLVELLRQTEAEIVCLVRAGGARAGHERLTQALAQHGLSVRTEERRRLGVVAGDLARPLLGLPEPTWNDLAQRVDAIYHVAGRVNLVLGYEVLRPDNVLGTLEVLRLWAARRARRLHHVSTLSVFVATDRNHGLLGEDDDLSRTGYVHGGYAQSKWAAEWLVRRAAGRGATYYRPGLITPDSRGGPAPGRDFLTLFLRGLARLGCLPPCDRTALALDVAPVDWVARALVYLSLHAAGDTFHLAGPRAVSLAEWTAALDRVGVQIEEVDPGRWRDRLLALEADDAEAAAACLALCRALPEAQARFEQYRTMDLFQATGVRFGMERALAGLAGSGIVCPDVDDALLDRYVALGLRS
jgi:amino acid adenylation domain-containing protein/thioester reductase-like protein